MSDSIDRVFIKAISTIRTLSTRTGYGSLPRPPLENRIKLYGLYKQSTEGDLRHILPPITRPIGQTPSDENAQRKFDAWKQQEGLSRTQAKRLYISFLISTMKLYGSGTLEARELLGELEYLWEQIKDIQSDGTNESDLGPGSVSRSVSYIANQRTGPIGAQQQRIYSGNLNSLNNSTLTGGAGSSSIKNGTGASFLESYIQETSRETENKTIKYELRDMNHQLTRMIHQLNVLVNRRPDDGFNDDRNYRLFKTVLRFLSSSVCKVIFELIVLVLVLKIYKIIKGMKNWHKVWITYVRYMEKFVDFLI